MHVEQKHTLGREEAIRRINASIEEMMSRELPAGVKVSNVTKHWTGDSMRFSFTAKKGFFGATITGVVQVTEGLVAMDAELPGILTAFISEDKIRGDIQKQFAQVLLKE